MNIDRLYVYKIKPLYIKIIEKNECKESENNEKSGILKVIQFH